MEQKERAKLELQAAQIRRWSIEQVYCAASGHPGGSLSLGELLAVLYWREMRVDPAKPADPERDRLVLSKGHCSPALYAALALRGFFPVEELKTFRRIDSRYSGHAEMKVPGVDMSTGSLGQGISAAVGMELAAKLDGADRRTYAILGDGELQEGQVWEAAMFAAHYKLDNLTVIVDSNKIQLSGPTNELMNVEPIGDKFRAFGFEVAACDGHDVAAVADAFAAARACGGKPFALVADTVKGKGVSFMENNAKWHGNAPNEEQYNTAVAELDAVIARLQKEVG